MHATVKRSAAHRRDFAQPPAVRLRRRAAGWRSGVQQHEKPTARSNGASETARPARHLPFESPLTQICNPNLGWLPRCESASAQPGGGDLLSRSKKAARPAHGRGDIAVTDTTAAAAEGARCSRVRRATEASRRAAGKREESKPGRGGGVYSSSGSRSSSSTLEAWKLPQSRFAVAAGAALASPRLLAVAAGTPRPRLAARLLLPAALRAPQRPQVKVVAAAAAAVAAASMWCRGQQPPS